MTVIRDLTAAQLARHAFNLFLDQGRTTAGARLTYQALALDPHEGTALRCLADLLADTGFPGAAAAVLEYALAPGTGLTDEARRELDELRFLSQWWGGFSRHETGLTQLSFEELKDRPRFVVDEAKWRRFVDEAVARGGGSLESAFRAAHTLLGAASGCLLHRQLGKKAPTEECAHPDRFERTPEYDSFLAGSTDDLDALEQLRQEKSWPS